MYALGTEQPHFPERPKNHSFGSQRIYGFDFLRAFGCISVVGFHALGRDTLVEKTLGTFVFGAAVPTFLIMSLFLTQSKGMGLSYIKSKSLKLLRLYCIWGWVLPLSIWLLFPLTRKGETIPKISFSLVYGTAMEGVSKLNLTGINSSGIYFIPLLIILTWISFSVRSFLESRKTCEYLVLFFSAINLLVPFAPNLIEPTQLNEAGNNLIFGGQTSPLGIVPFLIYIPAAKMIYTDYLERQDKLLKYSILFVIVYVMAALFEGGCEYFEGQLSVDFFHSAYGRLSVAMLATSLTYFGLGCKKKVSQTNIIGIFSRYSLGIYFLHGAAIGLLEMKIFLDHGIMLFMLSLSMAFLSTGCLIDIPYIKKLFGV
jgi:hypothetical protein